MRIVLKAVDVLLLAIMPDTMRPVGRRWMGVPIKLPIC